MKRPALPHSAELHAGVSPAFIDHVLTSPVQSIEPERPLEPYTAVVLEASGDTTHPLRREIGNLRLEREFLQGALAASEERADKLLTVYHDTERENRALMVENAQHKETIARVTNEKEKDPKTGLLNAVAFEEKVTQLVSTDRRRHRPDEGKCNFIMFCDLDDFKAWNSFFTDTINDSETLIPTARALERELREDEALISRWGGEEFAIFLRNVSPKDVPKIAERLKAALNSIPTNGTPRGIPYLGVSIGFSEYGPDDTYQEVISRADKAVDYIKRNIPGKNSVLNYAHIAHSATEYEQPALFEISSLK